MVRILANYRVSVNWGTKLDGGCCAIEFCQFVADNEHGNSRSIGARVPDLQGEIMACFTRGPKEERDEPAVLRSPVELVL